MEHPCAHLQNKAKLSLKKQKAKYAFIDHLNELRDREFNLTLAWDNMPRIGANAIYSHSVRAGRLPGAYMLHTDC